MDRKIYYYLAEIRNALKRGWAYPVTCEIDPSNNCMLNCQFCMYAEYLKSSGRGYLDFNLYQEVVSELHEMGVKSITFTGGGEPLMHPKFNSMVNVARLHKMETGLITNGVFLDRVRNLDAFSFIRVSVDASTPATYKRIKGRNKFEAVIENIAWALDEGAVLGLSFVVCEENKGDIEGMITLADKLGVKYVQFKPAWINGAQFTDYEIPKTKKVIDTKRYKAKDLLPCTIAGLVGVIGADANAYFCCQYRGDERFRLGTLEDYSFAALWQKRMGIEPDISACPQCRYMNYATAYKEAMKGETLFLEHKSFL